MRRLQIAIRTPALAVGLLLLAGCGGDRLAFTSPGSGPAPAAVQPSAPPVNMAGRWLLSSPGRGQCHVNFGAANAAAAEGTIAPEGGCPGKFFTSRKWSYEQGSLFVRDHNGQPLAQLSGSGSQFDGKATSGEPVTLMR
jgi:hypothetical protein